MRKLTNYLTIILLIIAFIGTSALFAQEQSGTRALAAPITSFPYLEGFDDCTIWPVTIETFAGAEAHVVLSEDAGYSGSGDCGVKFDGNSYVGFYHSSQCESAFDLNYPLHTAQILMNYIPDNSPGNLQLDFDFVQYFSFNPVYSWFRLKLVTPDGTVILDDNTGRQCFNSLGFQWRKMIYDLSDYQVPGQNYELIFEFVGKYEHDYYNQGDAVFIDNIHLDFIHTGNTPPVAVCQNVIVSADENCEGLVTALMVDNGSFDPDGDDITLSLNPKAPYPLGETIVTLTVTDVNGEEDYCEATITINDNEVPTLTVVSTPFTLWPPNHKYESFVLGDFVLSVDDNCTDVSISDVIITKVSSDEPENGTSSGNTLNDMIIADDCMSVQLRSEREGIGNGRVYTVYLELKDEYDNSATALCQVHVPHNVGETAIDDGPVYEVSGNCDNNRLFGLTAVDYENIEMIVYPNPFNNSINIEYELNQTSSVQVTIFNHLGNQIMKIEQDQMQGKQLLVLHAEDLAAGMYYCELKTKTGIQTVKLIKIK